MEPNPELEEIRNNVPARLNVDTMVAELRSKTSEIHAAFLFEEVAFTILQTILARLGATPVEGDDANWMTFGAYLGVTGFQLMNIRNLFQQKNEGPVYWVLATHAQFDDATIAEVIHALKETGREDIINLISDGVRELASCINSYRFLEGNKAGIFRTATIPPVPIVLKPSTSNVTKVYRIVNFNTITPNPGLRDNRELIRNATTIRPTVLKVLLTFDNDGTDAAMRITRILRSHPAQIGVLIFEEQMIHVSESDHDFVDDCIAQVDAIIPILTQGYFNKINNRPLASNTEPLGKDQELVRYIFDTIRGEFTMNNCVNKRVKCIKPNECLQLRERNPVLRSFFSESKIESLIELLLLERRQRH